MSEPELDTTPEPIQQEDYAQKNALELLVLMAGHTEVPMFFHFWSGMSLIAACLQNRVWYQHMAYKPTKPNLYIFLVGNSASGKGSAISLVSKVGRELEHGEDYVDLGIWKGKITDAYLYNLLATREDDGGPTQHPVWLQSDELSNSIRTGDMARSFIKVAVDLWEGHEGYVQEGTRLHGGNIILNPCMNWLAGSTMTWLKEVLDFSDIDSGVFGRIIVIQGRRSTQPIYAPDTSLYHILLPHLKQKLSTIWTYEGPMVLTDEAKVIEKQWYEIETKGEPGESFLQPTWGRRLDIVHKFAMIMQCAEGMVDDWNIITETTVKQAISLYTDLIGHYKTIVESIILGKSDRKMERVQAFLRKNKIVTMSRLQQSASNYGCRKEELNNIIKTLMDQDSVRKYNKPGSQTYLIEWMEH